MEVVVGAPFESRGLVEVAAECTPGDSSEPEDDIMETLEDEVDVGLGYEEDEEE